MMMQNPDDNLFQDLLSEYAAPVADDGFSNAVFQTIEAQTRKVERIRKVSIYGACFAGGAIAATQFSSLLDLAAKVNISMPQVSTLEASTIPAWSLAGIVLLGFVLWAALDRQVSEIF